MSAPAPELTSAQEIGRAFAEARTIAVLGFNPSTGKPANFVPQYLHDAGYRVIPVNPALAARDGDFHGEKARASLAEIDAPVDVVDVFRRAEHLEGHLEDILAMRPPPRVVWLQSGIRNGAFAERLREAGIAVVQDRCTMVEHRLAGIRRQ